MKEEQPAARERTTAAENFIAVSFRFVSFRFVEFDAGCPLVRGTSFGGFRTNVLRVCTEVFFGGTIELVLDSDSRRYKKLNKKIKNSDGRRSNIGGEEP